MEYTPLANIILGFFIFLFAFAVAVKAGALYYKTKDKRMAILSAGFFAGGCFEILHFTSSYNLNIQFYYVFFENFAFAVTVFLTIFYFTDPFNTKKINIRNTYLAAFLFLVLVVIAHKFITSKITSIIAYSSFEIIHSAIFFLSALILLDIRKSNKLKLFSWFILGVFLLGFSELYTERIKYYQSFYRYFVHIGHIIALGMIFFGLEENLFRSKIFSLKQKLLAYISIFSIFSYFFMSVIIAVLFKFYMPHYMNIFFWMFLMTVTTVVYITSNKLSKPVEHLIEKLKSFKPFEETIPQEVLTNDEIGLLSKEFHKRSVLIEQNEIKLKNSRDRERLLRKITDLFRSSLDIDEVLTIVCDEVAKLFNIQRAVLLQFVDDENSRGWQLKREYEKNSSYPPFDDSNTKDMIVDYWVENFSGKTNVVAISNINHMKIPEWLKYTYSSLGIKSIIGVFIRQGEHTWGILGLFEYDYYREWLKEEEELLETISTQIYIAIKQAELFSFEKIQKEREKIYANILEILRNTLDKKEITQYFVRAIGEYFKADRVLFSEFNPRKQIFLPVDEYSEYLSNDEQKSFINYDWTIPDAQEYVEPLLNKQELNIYDLDKYLAENEKSQSFINLFRDADVKSSYNIPVLYQNILMGYFCVEFTQKVCKLSEVDLTLIREICKQAAVAIHQSKLYSQIKENSQREKLLRDIIDTVRSTLDINEVKYKIVTETGKALNADRVIISSIDMETGILIKIQENTEYLSSPDVRSLQGFDPEEKENKFFVDLFKRREIFILNNVDDFIKNSSKQDFSGVTFLKNFDIKAGIGIPVLYQDQFLGILAIHFTKERRDFSEEEIQLAKNIANQVGIALYQAELYLKITIQAEREKLLREIINIIRQNLDFEVIKNTFVTELGRALNVDRVVFIEYNEYEQKFMPISTSAEYLKSDNIKSMAGLNVNDYPYFKKIFYEGEDIIVKNSREFLKTDIGGDPASEQYIRQYNIKSGLGLPIKHGDILMGRLIVQFTEEYAKLDDDYIEFMKSLANHAGIAIYQAKLWKKEKETAEREKLLRSITEMMRSSLDINETLTIICDSLAQLFNVQRATIVEFTSPGNYREYTVKREYKSSEEIKGVFESQDFIETAAYWGYHLLHNNKPLVIDDIANSDLPDYFKKTYETIGEKSALGFPIKKDEDDWGTLILSEYNYVRHWTAEEINLVKSITDQIYIAIKQAELFSLTQKQVKKEKTIRKVIETIRSSLNINEILSKTCDELWELFDVQRVSIAKINDESRENFFEIKHKKEIKGANLITDFKELYDYCQNYVEKCSDTKVIDRIEESDLPEKVKENYVAMGLKSLVGVPIKIQNEIWGGLFLSTYDKYKKWEQDEIEFFETIANQLGIAIKQAELFSLTQKQVKREETIREIIEVVRSSLDIDKVLKSVCDELLKLFNVQRVSVVKVTEKIQESFIESSETDTIKGIGSFGDFETIYFYWENYINVNKKTKVIDNIEESDLPENVKKSYLKTGMKSLIGIPINAENKIWGGLFLSSYDKCKKWEKDEIEFLETIISQLGVAIKQAELYNFQKQIARQESILRDIISEIKLTKDLKQAYNKLLQKLTEIFDLNRAVFLESAQFNREELIVKYEYTPLSEEPEPNEIIFPKICIDRFLSLINNLETLVISDIKECYADEKTLKFFKKYKIQSILAVPFVKYNRSVKILGFIVLCSSYTRNWTYDEISLLRSISESLVSIIWEISKIIEIDDLRNSFVLTLAHDFQVPLVGERKALEFLLSAPQNQPIDEYREIIEETINNNKDITVMLMTLVDIYNYESGIKKLHLSEVKLQSLINDVVKLNQGYAKSKGIKIHVEVLKDLPPLFIDYDEIRKVVSTILQNSITYNKKGGEVWIESILNEKQVIIRIIDNGNGIPAKVKERLFKRYEMALALERKIGSGLGLYLAKQIIQAHKGYIDFRSQEGKGTEFSFCLPVKSEKQ